MVADIKQKCLIENIILTPDELILDGRNRYLACLEAGVEPKFEITKEPPEKWLDIVISKNLKRRHLTASQRAAMAAELVNTVLGDNQHSGGSAKLPRLDQSGAAKLLNTSNRSVGDAVTVKNHSADLHQLVKAGSVTVDVAAKMVRHEPEHVTKFIGEVNAGNEPPTVLREINRLKRLDQIEQKTGREDAGALPDGSTDIKSVLARLIDAGRKWPVALIDPPWQYENPFWNDNNRSPPYPTMTLGELKELPVPDIMTDDAVLFLWSTAPKLDEAIDLLRAWNFRYRTCAVWIKDRIGMGYWFRGQHEHLLVARRGDFPRPRPEDCVSSVIQAARGEHSEKPEAVHEILEAYFPGSSKIELFARKTRKGWAAAGNEIEGGFVDFTGLRSTRCTMRVRPPKRLNKRDCFQRRYASSKYKYYVAIRTIPFYYVFFTHEVFERNPYRCDFILF